MIVVTQQPTRDAIARHYDQLDTFYREIWGDHLHHGLWLDGDESPSRAVEQLAERVAEEAGVRLGDAVCDVGCGYGATALLLSNRFGARVTGFTISESQYCYALEGSSAGVPVTFQLCDWLENGLPDASQDAVVSIECLSHISDQRRWFLEVERVLRPGGRAVITAWLSAPDPQGWQMRCLLEPICNEGRLCNLGNHADYRQLIHQAGLELEHFEDLTPQVRKTWRVCAGALIKRFLTSPRYVRAALGARQENHVFAVTVFRILVAYYTGAMRYGLFRARKP